MLDGGFLLLLLLYCLPLASFVQQSYPRAKSLCQTDLVQALQQRQHECGT